MNTVVIIFLLFVIIGLAGVLATLMYNQRKEAPPIQEHSPEVYEWVRATRFEGSKAELELHDIDANYFLAMTEHAVKRKQQQEQT